MKRRTLQLLVVVIVLSLCGSTAFAWKLWPGAMKGKGHWVVDASWIQQEINVRGCEEWHQYDWITGGSWDLTDWDCCCVYIKNLRSNIFLASIEYGLCDMFDVALLLGVCDVKGKVTWPCYTDEEMMDGGYGLAIGGAARGTFCQWDGVGPKELTGKLIFGWNGQFLYMKPGDTSYTYDTGYYGYLASVNAKQDWWQGRCLLGFGWQRNRLGLYADAGCQWVCGDFEWSYTVTSDGAPVYRETGENGKFRQDACFIFAAGGWYKVKEDLHIGGGTILGDDVNVYYVSGQYRFR